MDKVVCDIPVMTPKQKAHFDQAGTRRIILDKVQEGYSLDAACGVAGVSASGLYAWMKRGQEDEKNPDEDVLMFVEALQIAKDGGEAHIIEKILKDPKNLTWYAQARWPERYNPKRIMATKAEVGDKNGSIKITFEEEVDMPDDMDDDEELPQEGEPVEAQGNPSSAE